MRTLNEAAPYILQKSLPRLQSIELQNEWRKFNIPCTHCCEIGKKYIVQADVFSIGSTTPLTEEIHDIQEKVQEIHLVQVNI